MILREAITVTGYRWQSDGEIAKKVFGGAALSDELKRSTITQEIAEMENDAKPVNINGEKVKLQIAKV